MYLMGMKLRTGVFADRPGVDGKVFTKAAIEGALADPMLQARLDAGMLGSFLKRDLDRVADISNPTHRVLSVGLESTPLGAEIVADVEFLDTPEGRDAQAYLNLGAKIIGKPVLCVDWEADKLIKRFTFHRIQLELIGEK